MFEHVVSDKRSALSNFSIHWPQGPANTDAELKVPRRFMLVGLSDGKARELREILGDIEPLNPIIRCIAGGGDTQDADAVRLIDVDNGLSLDMHGHTSATSPAIAIVGRDLPDIDRLFARGFIDYITYPFSFLEIQRRLLTTLTVIRQPAFTARPRVDPMVWAACKSLEANLANPVTVDELAAALGTNRNTLNRAFNQAFDVGPITWLRLRRCEVAAQLLRDTSESVLNIALTVGYGDPNNFSTAFRRIYNQGPLEFRRKMSGAKNLGTGSKAGRRDAS
jgi:AraC-like DNA-binding protein